MVKSYGVKEVETVVLKSFTGSPTGEEGEIYYNSTDKVIQAHTGSGFENLGGSSSFWWEDSEQYDVWEDFGLYSESASPSGTKWDMVETLETPGLGDAVFEVVTANYTDGLGTKEFHIWANIGGTFEYANAKATTKTLTDNKHKFFRFVTNHLGDSPNTSFVKISMGNATDGWTDLLSESFTDSNTGRSMADATDYRSPMSCLILAKGSDVYDAYINGYKVATDITKANSCQVKIEAQYRDGDSTNDVYRSEIYVDNILESKEIL